MRGALSVIFVVLLVEGFVDARQTQTELPARTITKTTTTTTTTSASWKNYALNGRIVNGTKAALRQFPYQVSLRRSWSAKHFCGGVLISDRHVLTAAHCMYMNDIQIQPWTIVVVAGELQLNRATSTGQRRGVEMIFVHPQFDHSTLRNDITVLILKVPFKITLEVKNAPLPLNPPVAGSVCQVSGWGYPAEDIHISNNDLMYIDLPIMKVELCRKLLENVTALPPGMYCAGYLEGGRDACQGDSGGGMFCNGVVTGVISGGEGCAIPRLPGVYADVYHYRNWILSKTMTSFSKLSPSGVDRIQPTTIVSSLLLCLLALFCA